VRFPLRAVRACVSPWEKPRSSQRYRYLLVGEEALPTPQIRIRTLIQEDHVIIGIADNGAGMTEEVRKRVFDPFFTTKPVGKGTGMGLSISYQIIVKKHGGQIQCISAPGEGAEFAIVIPFKEQPDS